MTIYLLVFLIVGVFLLNFYSSRWTGNGEQTRRKGKLNTYKPTMFQVRELIIKGEKDMAIKYYCQIFSVKREDAQIAVDELERSIQEKKK
mgnify:CR=1 FL=1